MKFSEIKYERVDLEARKRMAEALLQRLRNAASFEALEQVILEDSEMEGQGLMTMRTLAQIRHDMDTRDAFYDEEVKFYSRELPKYQHLSQEWTKALLESSFRRELEEKYGGVSLLNAEIGSRTFKPELVEDLQKENELVARYTKLIASAQIEFDGKTLSSAPTTSSAGRRGRPRASGSRARARSWTRSSTSWCRSGTAWARPWATRVTRSLATTGCGATAIPRRMWKNSALPSRIMWCPFASAFTWSRPSAWALSSP